MSNGIAYQQPDLTRNTSVIASGLWRTGEEMLPTLTRKGNYNRKGVSKKSGDGLATVLRRDAASMLPTLTSADSVRGPDFAREHGEGSGGDDLVTHLAKRMMPTLISRDWKDTPGMSLTGVNPDGSTRKREDTLPRAVFAAMMPTLKATDGERGGRGETLQVLRGAKTGRHPLGASASGSPKRIVIRGGLNPTWCEWYMGLPTGWTESTHSGTATRRLSRKRSRAS